MPSPDGLADGSSVLYALRESLQAYVSVAYIEPLIFADLLRPPEVGGAAFPTSLFGFSGIGARRRWNQSMFVFIDHTALLNILDRVLNIHDRRA